eukprot:13833803-Ditylum_brightwellii.AAC.1
MLKKVETTLFILLQIALFSLLVTQSGQGHPGGALSHSLAGPQRPCHYCAAWVLAPLAPRTTRYYVSSIQLGSTKPTHFLLLHLPSREPQIVQGLNHMLHHMFAQTPQLCPHSRYVFTTDPPTGLKPAIPSCILLGKT